VAIPLSKHWEIKSYLKKHEEKMVVWNPRNYLLNVCYYYDVMYAVIYLQLDLSTPSSNDRSRKF